jgi:hypothetical protein
MANQWVMGSPKLVPARDSCRVFSGTGAVRILSFLFAGLKYNPA